MLISLIACKETNGNDDGGNSDTNHDSGGIDAGAGENGNDSNNDSNNDSTDSTNSATQLCGTHNYTDNICSVCGCSLWNGQADSSWYSALNTEFTISTAEQFAGLIETVNNGSDLYGAQITLACHIDMNNLSLSPIGANEETKFAGSFDGKGFTVSNVKITTQSVVKDFENTSNRGDLYTCHAGLFGYSTGSISNVSVTNIDIDIAGTQNCRLYVGGLVGESHGDITNCYVKGKINVSGEDSFYIGGIVGNSDSCAITNAHSKIEIQTIYDASNEGELWRYFSVGGIIGKSYEASVERCYSTGSIAFSSEDEYHSYTLGGLIGDISGKSYVTNSFSTASVSANGKAEGAAGGLIGRLLSTKVEFCYSVGPVVIQCAYGNAAGLVGSAEICNGLSNVWSASDVTIQSANGNAASVANIHDDIQLCYYLNTQELIGGKLKKNGNPVTANDLKNVKLYTSIMTWNTDVWNIVNGEYPSLK